VLVVLPVPPVIPALAPAVLEIPPALMAGGSSELPQPERATPKPARPEIQRTDFTVIISRSPHCATAARASSTARSRTPSENRFKAKRDRRALQPSGGAEWCFSRQRL
jgi:hypothetical protein